jgi:hypothetical protein
MPAETYGRLLSDRERISPLPRSFSVAGDEVRRGFLGETVDPCKQSFCRDPPDSFHVLGDQVLENGYVASCDARLAEFLHESAVSFFGGFRTRAFGDGAAARNPAVAESEEMVSGLRSDGGVVSGHRICRHSDRECAQEDERRALGRFQGAE